MKVLSYGFYVMAKVKVIVHTTNTDAEVDTTDMTKAPGLLKIGLLNYAKKRVNP